MLSLVKNDSIVSLTLFSALQVTSHSSHASDLYAIIGHIADLPIGIGIPNHIFSLCSKKSCRPKCPESRSLPALLRTRATLVSTSGK